MKVDKINKFFVNDISVEYVSVTAGENGLMTSSDKIKLDALSEIAFADVSVEVAIPEYTELKECVKELENKVSKIEDISVVQEVSGDSLTYAVSQNAINNYFSAVNESIEHLTETSPIILTTQKDGDGYWLCESDEWSLAFNAIKTGSRSVFVSIKQGDASTLIPIKIDVDAGDDMFTGLIYKDEQYDYSLSIAPEACEIELQEKTLIKNYVTNSSVRDNYQRAVYTYYADISTEHVDNTVVPNVLGRTTMPADMFYYVDTKFYQNNTSVNNRTQVAWPYSQKTNPAFRYFSSNKWSEWNLLALKSDIPSLTNYPTNSSVSTNYVSKTTLNEPWYPRYTIELEYYQGWANFKTPKTTVDAIVNSIMTYSVSKVFDYFPQYILLVKINGRITTGSAEDKAIATCLYPCLYMQRHLNGVSEFVNDLMFDIEILDNMTLKLKCNLTRYEIIEATNTEISSIRSDIITIESQNRFIYNKTYDSLMFKWMPINTPERSFPPSTENYGAHNFILGTSNTIQGDATCFVAHNMVNGLQNNLSGAAQFGVVSGTVLETYNMSESAFGVCNNSYNAGLPHGCVDASNGRWEKLSDWRLFTIGNGMGADYRHNALDVRFSGEIYIPYPINNNQSWYKAPMVKIQDKFDDIKPTVYIKMTNVTFDAMGANYTHPIANSTGSFIDLWKSNTVTDAKNYDIYLQDEANNFCKLSFIGKVSNTALNFIGFVNTYGTYTSAYNEWMDNFDIVYVVLTKTNIYLTMKRFIQ